MVALSRAAAAEIGSAYHFLEALICASKSAGGSKPPVAHGLGQALSLSFADLAGLADQRRDLRAGATLKTVIATNDA